MSRILNLVVMALALCTADASTVFSNHRGVWSSDSAEAVLTDSICIFYCQTDSIMQAFLEIPAAGISSKTVFAKDGTVTTTSDNEPLVISEADGILNICGHALRKVEDIKIVPLMRWRVAIQEMMWGNVCSNGVSEPDTRLMMRCFIVR